MTARHYEVARSGDETIVKQALGGGEPMEIVKFEENYLFDFGFSPDGQMLAVTRGAWQQDIVRIEDLNH